eukprot:GHVH01003700.1.p1 GENE.GHVH01003700.1~~GHVH01003700.1.p1  ORF type:complete len:559 (+),score=44.42 GHVH01003700.1:1155-2831(+)
MLLSRLSTHVYAFVLINEIICGQVIPDTPPSGDITYGDNVNAGLAGGNQDTIDNPDELQPALIPEIDLPIGTALPPPSPPPYPPQEVIVPTIDEQGQQTQPFPGGPGCKSYRTFDFTPLCPPKYEHSEITGRCERLIVTPPNVRCPDGYIAHGSECLGYEVNPPHHLCPNGYENHGKLCEKMEYSNRMLVCPEGYSMKNLQCSRLVSTESIKECPRGTKITPEGCSRKDIVEIDASCKDGWNFFNGLCTKTSTLTADLSCPYDEILTTDYRCIKVIKFSPLSACPEDHEFIDSNMCAKLVEVMPQSRCAEGHETNGKCQVETQKDDNCVKGDCIERFYSDVDLVCPSGFVLDIESKYCYTHIYSPVENICAPLAKFNRKDITCDWTISRPADRICLSGYELHEDQCTIIEAYKPLYKCSQGEYAPDRDVCETTRVEEFINACPAGFEIDGDVNCIAERFEAGEMVCQPGFKEVQYGGCERLLVHDPENVCLEGERLSNGSCRLLHSVPMSMYCPFGYDYLDGTCQLSIFTAPVKVCDDNGTFEKILEKCFLCLDTSLP